jgi:hypothetical protein
VSGGRRPIDDRAADPSVRTGHGNLHRVVLLSGRGGVAAERSASYRSLRDGVTLLPAG